MRGFKTPIVFFALWVLLLIIPVLVPESVSDEIYDAIYFFASDLSVVALALACYFSLSYTSVVNKGLSLSAVIISTLIFASNMLVEYSPIPVGSTTGLFVFGGVFSTLLFLLRFLFRIYEGGYMKPEHDRIYLIVNKPRNFIGMIGLLYSGIGGGFSAYVNGDCYWFPRKEKCLVKTHDKDYYKGRYLIDCGPVTGDKINDLESMIGQKWSIFNNCFTVFGRWRRKWG